MPVGGFTSANGKLVRLEVERKFESGVFGKELIHEGVADYALRRKEGFWIIGKSEVYPSNLSQLLREGVREILGSYPIAMDTTFLSHLDWLAWEGTSTLQEEQVLLSLGRKVERSDILLDERRAVSIRAQVQTRVRTDPRRRELVREIDSLRGRIRYMGKKSAKEAEERIAYLEGLLRSQEDATPERS